MKSQLRFRSLPLLATVSTLALALAVVAFRAQADQWDKKTILTINQPIQVRDTFLEPGTYVFKLLDSNSDRHIVQIFNKDQSHIINTVLAIPNSRMEPKGDSQFEFWETPPGTARAMRAWFYPGDTFGQEFPYPKHLRQLEVAAVMTTSRPDPKPAPAPEPSLAPTPEPAPPAQTAAPEPPKEEPRKTEIALALPPAAPSPVAEQAGGAPEPQATPAQPEELPKTATYYPAVGLGGLLLLGLYGWVRWSHAS